MHLSWGRLTPVRIYTHAALFSIGISDIPLLSANPPEPMHPPHMRPQYFSPSKESADAM